MKHSANMEKNIHQQDHLDLSSRLSGRIFILLVLVGLGVRLINLGKFGYWTDELYHAIAARSLIDFGHPFVPDVGSYTRSLPFTYVVTGFVKILGETEFYGRLPSVLFNILMVMVAYAWTRRNFDKMTALVFSFILLFTPFEIFLARECRMYALFQLLFFLGSLFYLSAFQNSERVPGYDNSHRRVKILNLLYFLAAMILLVFSLKVHTLTVNFAFIALTFSLVEISRSLIVKSPGRASLKMHGSLLFLAMIAAFGLLFLMPGVLKRFMEIAMEIPAWSGGSLEGDSRYYLGYLKKDYLPLLLAYPMGLILLYRKNTSTGSFFAVGFLTLLFLHSLVFARKNPRYIFYIFPFFLFPVSVFYAALINFLKKRFNDHSNNRSRKTKRSVDTAVVGILILSLYPWFFNGFKLPFQTPWEDWKTVLPLTDTVRGSNSVITTRPYPVYYYFGIMPDYVLRGEYAYKGRQTYQYGRHLFSTEFFGDLAILKEILDLGGQTLFITDEWAFKNPAFVTDDVRQFIQTDFQGVQHGGDQRILVYRHAGSQNSIP